MSDLNLEVKEGELVVKYWKLDSIYKLINEGQCRVTFNGFVSESGYEKAPNSPTTTKVITVEYCDLSDKEVILKCQELIDTPITETI